ncbi:MAG: CidA/LrgA family protein [Planctomycetes bacterium]|nr:CidA/LrgA family protein [Planctomycetota bacterium]
MLILQQLGIILAFAACGHLLANGLGLPLPNSVIGLILLLGGLRLRLLPEWRIGNVAQFLSANMAFFFLPSAVEIVENYAHIQPILLEILVVCTASTITTFCATYAVVRLLHRTRAAGQAGR